MGVGKRLTVGQVRDLVRRGQVIKAPNYHSGKRGLGYLQVLTALERCNHVAPDERTDERGRPLHPRGWYALAPVPHRRRLRVDFDLVEDAAGRLILVVTAYQV